MPKRTVRAAIPTASPDDMGDLVTKLWEYHQSLGASSPFFNNNLVDMTRFEELMNEALSKRKQAQDLYDEAVALMQESRKAFGIDVGQTLSTVDTLYYLVNNIKHFLLVKHRGREEALSHWGFNVVIGSSAVGAKKKKKQKS